MLKGLFSSIRLYLDTVFSMETIGALQCPLSCTFLGQ